MAETIILDTDPGIDDAMAIMYVLANKHLKLMGITTVFGNATIEDTTRNALFIKDKFNASFDVACGAAAPLIKTPNGPTVIVHGEHGLGSVVADAPKSVAEEETAWQYMAKKITANPGEITLVAVGPLTNLALLVQNAPEAVSLVKNVVIMGGAFGENGHRGNVSPVAEANVHDDPHAANIVFAANWPVVVIGLDVTHEIACEEHYIETLRDHAGEKGRFIYDVSQFYLGFYETELKRKACYLHDPAALVYVSRPELFELREGPIVVVEEGGAEGMTIQKTESRVFSNDAWEQRPSQSVAISVDSEAVLNHFSDTLIGDHA
ncbi:nucleoside hydrolase [Veronia nyctiphanis]|uniref:Nucleoside hydrolase n=1 Tax=Veronia nyctiphanis TaxID=1278244 RepID=A0A4Q0YPV4_9GAMM|nr:nucleoside hydrolase [Veronia nyctiphanis]RXJ71824.1 nucleoside hydrolase [Veronia nyctiphanis]RXJ72575.1 nucleoside hydrolase [Veronia nyctiphanis]